MNSKLTGSFSTAGPHLSCPLLYPSLPSQHEARRRCSLSTEYGVTRVTRGIDLNCYSALSLSWIPVLCNGDDTKPAG